MRKKGIGPFIILTLMAAACLSGCGEKQQVVSDRPVSTIEATADKQATNSATTPTTVSESVTNGQSVHSSENYTKEVPHTSERTSTSSINATVLIYMVGSDLESSYAAASLDLLEMIESDIDLERANVLVYTGGASEWHVGIPSNKNVLLRLVKDDFVLENQFELMSMGNPQNLSRFLNYAWDHYDSQRFDLIIWNHGAGPMMGCGLDTLFDNDLLTLTELKEALDASPFNKNNKLGFIGFDACLMSSLEMAVMVGDYAEWMVSSQETEPAYGWNYAFLKDAGSTTSLEISKAIVDSYIEYYEMVKKQNPYRNEDVTLSVLDLSKTEAFYQRWEALFGTATEDVSGAYNKLASYRHHSYSYGRGNTGSEFDLVDAGALLDQMQPRYHDLAQKAKEQLNEFVVYEKSNLSHSSGVSIYYPFYNKDYYEYVWQDTLLDMGIFHEYTKYITRFSKVWLGTGEPSSFSAGQISNPRKEGESFRMSLTDKQAESLASCGYYILKKQGEGLYTALLYSDQVDVEGNTLTVNYDGNAVYAKVGEKKWIPALSVRNTDDNSSDFIVSAVTFLTEGWEDKQSAEIWLNVDYYNNKVSIKGIYPMSQAFGDVSLDEETKAELFTGKRIPIVPEEWNSVMFSEVHTRYLKRNEDGSIPNFWEWTIWEGFNGVEFPLTSNLEFVLEPLYADGDGDEFFIMFSLQDLQGNQFSSELLPIDLPLNTDAGHNIDNEAVTLPLDGDKVLLYDDKGLKLELFCREENQGVEFFLKEDNQSDSKRFTVHLKDFLIDDSVTYLDNTVFDNYFFDSIGTKSYNEKAVQALNHLLILSETENLRQIEFTLNVSTDADTSESRIRLLLNSNSELKSKELTFDEIFDAKAEKQLLYEDNELFITLVGAGKSSLTTWGESMTLLLQLENKGENVLPLQVGGLSINGVFDRDLFFVNYKELKPGNKAYYMCEIPSYSFFSRANMKPLIENLQILLLRSEESKKAIWLPVVLSSKADYVEEAKTGEPCYDEKGITIRVLPDASIAKSSLEGFDTHITWKLSVENATDQSVIVSAIESNIFLNGEKINEEVKKSVGFSSVFAPDNRMNYKDLSIDYVAPIPEGAVLEIIFSIRTWDNEKELYTSSSPLRLPLIVPEE